MSGIAGILHTRGGAVEPAELAAMAAALAHRGRDAAGEWIDGPLGLAHRLLATTRALLSQPRPQQRHRLLAILTSVW